jgi:hypothetical protein
MDSDSTTGTYQQGGPYDPCRNLPAPHGGKCPRCGYCPCCGRGGGWWPPQYPWVYPGPYYVGDPPYPYYGTWTVTCSNSSGGV